MESDLFVCACYNVEHQIIFGYDPKWDEIYVSIHLRPDNFFKRIKNAIKYIFGEIVMNLYLMIRILKD